MMNCTVAAAGGFRCTQRCRTFRDRGPRNCSKCPSYTRPGSARRGVSVSASDVDAAAQVQVDNINDRVRYITSKSQLDLELDVAADRLVVLELMAENACETGLFEPEPEDHWTPQSEQKQKKMEVCAGIRHSYVEMAADSPDSRFLAVMEEESNPTDIATSLGISVFPAVVFFKNGRVVWQTSGSKDMDSDMAEGLLYFGGAQMDRADSVDCVSDLKSSDDVDQFVKADTAAKLKMLMVTTNLCSPCVHIYPSYVTLAMNFRDLVDFGRVDVEDERMAALCEQLRIREVPTFISYCAGEEVDRLISGNRGDLIGHLLGLSMKFGIDPPRPA